MNKKVRSKYFFVTGGIGAFLGFFLMNPFVAMVPDTESQIGNLVKSSFYFSGFGLAVGAALGMTEGLVQKKMGKMVLGLVLGLVLGTLCGGIGGGMGQFIYGLLPIQQKLSLVDVAIAIDSSSSMVDVRGLTGWKGNDPGGERRKAAKKLIDKLKDSDRVAVIDFDAGAQVVFSLTQLGSPGARTRAKRAVNRINADGGTNLSRGLSVSIAELKRHRQKLRPQHIIFLTDGNNDDSRLDGPTLEAARVARRLEITVHTIGLGNNHSGSLLKRIAHRPQDYHHVSRASDLVPAFERIYSKTLNVTKSANHQLNSLPKDGLDGLRFFFRIISWAVIGLVIGFGQGIRENTVADLRACSWGGLIGGMIGGALFDPITQIVQVGGESVGLGLADVVVGACIGGSMRRAQEKIVRLPEGNQGKGLIPFLPRNDGLAQTEVPPEQIAVQPNSICDQRPTSLFKQKQGLTSLPPSQKHPLSHFETQFPNRHEAMIGAYRLGGYSTPDIAEHFGVHVSTVERIVSEGPRS